MESSEARQELEKLKKKAKRNKKVLIVGGVMVGYIIFRRSVNKQVARQIAKTAAENSDVWLTVREGAKDAVRDGFKFKATNEELSELVRKGGGLLFETESPFGDFVLQSYETWAKVG